MRYTHIIISTFFLLFATCVQGQQSSKRKVLEAKRKQLQKDKIYINALLSNTKRKEENLSLELNDLNDKIQISKKIISVISKESSELEKEIDVNESEINRNKSELKALKKDYSDLIYKSYKSKSREQKLLFLFASENFTQAFKRFNYMKQFNAHRKKQIEEIIKKTTLLSSLNSNLNKKQKSKDELLVQKKRAQNSVNSKKKKHQNLIVQLKGKESKYKKQIEEFIASEQRINIKIDQLIKDAIRASNLKASKTNTSFRLTAEAKILATKFFQNKGKLPWPVAKGYISTFYGKQPHPVYKSLTIQSNGVRITTNEGSKARAVFDGTVIAIQLMDGNKKTVLIQHGNYISVYKNLENIFVSKGENVLTKQEIGTIFTDKITSKTILSFMINNNLKTENPSNWIYKVK
jgi:septal ring factor EnvC (AmiA/AmiB activator)